MSERSSFRRRLLVRLGLAIVAVLAVLAAGTWTAAVVWSTHEARQTLRTEVLDLQHGVVTDEGALDVDRFDWSEVHHQFAARRVDPVFLQVFDADGRLLRASANVAALPPEALPARPLPRTDGDGPFTPLATHDLGGRMLYRVTEPLVGRGGAVVGTAQVARYVPPLPAHLDLLAGALALVFGLAATVLLGVLWAVGGRVVEPLQVITAHAARLSASTLGERVPVPSGADRETAALAEALNDGLDRLDAAFAEMQRFTANAAHELQTPLAILRGHVDVTLRRARAPEAYRDTLHLLGAEVDILTQTVHGLLALARLDAGGDLPLSRVDLGDVAQREAETFRLRAEAEGLALAIDADCAVVQGHESLLQDVVRNLVDNAVKYTDSGRVAVQVARVDGEVVLSVSDTGRGLPTDDAEAATGRFWRAPDVQHLPGSGLGLALVHRVVERHGGRLAVRAPDGGGTRVVVALPAADA